MTGPFRTRSYSNDLLYIAYNSNNKRLICYSAEKNILDLYLMRCGIYDDVTIFKTEDPKFIQAIRDGFYELCLVKFDLEDGLFICTVREDGYLSRLDEEYYRRTDYIMRELSTIINALDFDEKELKALIKAGKVLSSKRKIRQGLLPKGILDNKTLRQLSMQESELYGDRDANDDNFNLVCSRYYVILI